MMDREGSDLPSLVINPNVELVSVLEFAPDVREMLGGSETDSILSVLHSRATSQRIDAETADFLRLFAEPMTIIDAVIAYSAATEAVPAELLDRIYPLVASFQESGVLLESSEDAGLTAGGSLAPGHVIDSVRIVRSVQVLEDTEVYEGIGADGERVGLKRVKAEAPEFIKEALRQEYQVLQHLSSRGTSCAPRPADADFDRPDPLIIMEWREGRTLVDVVNDDDLGPEARARLFCRVLGSYVELHRNGIIHGDVHPSNVLIDDAGQVTVLDYGGAQLPIVPFGDRRVGLVAYYEPETAQRFLNGHAPLPPTEAGEQYAVAVLAYLVVTRGMYIPLSLETERSLRQIVEMKPRPFRDMHLTWPEVEQALARALEKDPRHRYGTFEEFTACFTAAVEASKPGREGDAPSRAAGRDAGARSVSPAFERCVDRVLDRYGLGAALTRGGLSDGPTASIYHGAAGISYALLRLACVTSSPEALAAADVWICRALDERTRESAFIAPSIDVTPEAIGPLALFHRETGLHVVDALVQHAGGDTEGRRLAVMAFVDSCRAAGIEEGRASAVTSFPVDATRGETSLLLGASMLMPLCGPAESGLQASLRSIAHAALGIVGRELSSTVDRDGPAAGTYLGFAHGLAGAIFAILRWSDASGELPPPEVEARLELLADQALSIGGGHAWPIEYEVPKSPIWSGWCHGSAGHLLLWSVAARTFGRDAYHGLAVGTGKHLLEARNSGASICCGLGGESLALFELARLTGEPAWLDHGRTLARQALESSESLALPHGLFRGRIGVDLVGIEALNPEGACWPFCQSPA